MTLGAHLSHTFLPLAQPERPLLLPPTVQPAAHRVLRILTRDQRGLFLPEGMVPTLEGRGHRQPLPGPA